MGATSLLIRYPQYELTDNLQLMPRLQTCTYLFSILVHLHDMMLRNMENSTFYLQGEVSQYIAWS